MMKIQLKYICKHKPPFEIKSRCFMVSDRFSAAIAKIKSFFTLSQYIWTLKDNDVPYSVNWRIIAKGKSYSSSNKKCDLCLKEKYYIICKPDMASLNNRNELDSECRHRKKHLLCNY